MSNLIEQITEDEGFRPYPYKDSLGIDTVGIGTRLPFTMAEVETVMRDRFAISLENMNDGGIKFQSNLFPLSKEEATVILKFRLNQKISGLLEAKPIVLRFPIEKQEILFNMIYQMGVNGVLNFKMMWEALEIFDYKEASIEGMDSRWAKQTPNRAKKLMDQMSA